LAAYEACGWNAFMTVAAFPTGNLTAFIGDAEVIKEIVNDRTRFPKPLEPYGVLQVYGLVSQLHTVICDISNFLLKI
jgi:hypothetical protein